MTEYIVRVVQMDGVERYITKQKKRNILTERHDKATRYDHLSSARRAVTEMRSRYPKLWHISLDINDANDAERGSF